MELVKEYGWYVGIDWASEKHQVSVVDSCGSQLENLAVENSGVELRRLALRMLGRSEGRPELVAVAIETPRGPVVEAMLESGFAVYTVNPKQSDRLRDQYSVSGAKDDRRDAYVLADSLRKSRNCFRRVQPDPAKIVCLRDLSRLEDDLREELSREANRLREQLLRYYVQVVNLCPGANEPWIWDLLEMAPTPAEGARLQRGRLAKLLQTYRIRRFSPDDLLQALRSSAVPVAAGTVEAASLHVRYLLPRLRLAKKQRTECEKRVEQLLQEIGTDEESKGDKREHRDVEILRSLPGIGRFVIASMLGEAYEPLADRDYHRMRTLSGTAPVTIQSGKKRVVTMRRACNQRLRNALYYWTLKAIQLDPMATRTYQLARARGQRHGSALRLVSDRLLAVAFAMLRNGTLYDRKRREDRIAELAIVA